MALIFLSFMYLIQEMLLPILLLMLFSLKNWTFFCLLNAFMMILLGNYGSCMIPKREYHSKLWHFIFLIGHFPYIHTCIWNFSKLKTIEILKRNRIDKRKRVHVEKKKKGEKIEKKNEEKIRNLPESGYKYIYILSSLRLYHWFLISISFPFLFWSPNL